MHLNFGSLMPRKLFTTFLDTFRIYYIKYFHPYTGVPVIYLLVTTIRWREKGREREGEREGERERTRINHLLKTYTLLVNIINI